MVVFNIYIFNRDGTFLYYYEWNRRTNIDMPKFEEFKLLHGMLFSIKSFVTRLSPTDGKNSFLSYQTNKYKLHFYETPTGLKFVMNTDLTVGNIKPVLHDIYNKVYVEYIIKNPLAKLNEPIQSSLFSTKLDELVKSLPFF
ncbi:trafficking protein particle complex subunit 1-like [Xenia sp. Carnegie-2017]|uniref:trafficking protein particle complex subunit 1-like n=1 Tax=Xenia sp. Carnegie-2017 TaxID=2897299 RepID=UPI001F03F236|nr:trafficking protein particle complex subunit 1-like [Xenia sp. Carnegie-2017]